MDDRNTMESILLEVKGVCDLYMHGTIESATPDVHCAFDSALQDALCMQNEIYEKMQSRGWYQTSSAQPQQIEQTRQQYAGK